MLKKAGKRFFKPAALVVAVAISIGLLGGCVSNNPAANLTAITNVRIFDGENLLDDNIVRIEGSVIKSIGGEIPDGATSIDGGGGTLMPGLIDSHTHTDMDGLKDALKFGVTTELEMNGSWTKSQRKKIATHNDIADVRSPEQALTAPGGHPTQYMENMSNLLIRWFFKYPTVSTPDEATKFVDKQIKKGADYIKIIIEEGTVVGNPGLNELDDETIAAIVETAHAHDKMAIAHITTAVDAKRAVDAGVDGLAHMFFDEPQTPELIDELAASGMFVVPTLVTASSAFGNSGAELAADERVSSRLDKKWLDSLSGTMNVYPQGNLDDVFAGVKALYDAGVDILAGSDVSEPVEGLGGLAHGASLHHELRLLVAAGFSPTEALRAATSVPARRFGLDDRGRIAPGLCADLLLVDGDPLTDIDDTLNIRAVWHRGAELAD
jgi:imidazolonepropionase-like amidohydrolase